jgi:sulfur carrier protein ThiS
MNVSVHLHTILQRQTPEGLVRQLELSVPPQSNISDLLTKLEIDFPLDSLLLVVNGRLVEEGHVLQEGDKVNLMPAISGGASPAAGRLCDPLPKHWGKWEFRQV